MKKYALLLMMLAVTSTAWGGPFACVQVSPADPSCESEITICVSGCLPGNCEVTDTEVCIQGGIITVDIHMCCSCECAPPYSTKFNECMNIGSLCPGAYVVIAKVHCHDCGQCSKFGQTRVGAVGVAFFDVCCADPCMPWYRPCAPGAGCCN